MSARIQRAQRRAAQSAPQPRRVPIRVQSAARANREILSEHSSDDRYSEYEPTDDTEDSVTFTDTATSRMRSEARMTPSTALLTAREPTRIDRTSPPTPEQRRRKLRQDGPRCPGPWGKDK